MTAGGGGDAAAYDRAPFAAVVAAMLVLQGAAHIGLLAAGVHAGAGATAAPALHIVLAIVAAWVVVSADRAIASAYAALQAVIAGILELLYRDFPRRSCRRPYRFRFAGRSSARSRAARRRLGSDRARAPLPPFAAGALDRRGTEQHDVPIGSPARRVVRGDRGAQLKHHSGANANRRRAPPIRSHQGHPLSGTGDACTAGRVADSAAHVELFAHGRALLIPVGVGVGHGCRRSLWTTEPTGVIHMSGGEATLGRLFAIWGQPLSHNRLAGFTAAGPVRVYVDGVRIHEPPQSVALRPHSEVVVELGGYVPPHRFYIFPEGT